MGIISGHSRHDQNVKKGHLHAMHVLVGDPPARRLPCRPRWPRRLPDSIDERCPDAFRRAARETLAWRTRRDLSAPEAPRRELLAFIADFAAWGRRR